MTSFSPRDLARRCGISTDTLRHYERRGVLAPPPRSPAGYRRYPASALPRVQLIQRALVVGFSLADLADVLAERARGGAPCRRVHGIVTARLSDLDRQIASLQALRRDLHALVRTWEARLARTAPGQPARLLEDLPSGVALDQRRGRRSVGRAGH